MKTLKEILTNLGESQLSELDDNDKIVTFLEKYVKIDVSPYTMFTEYSGNEIIDIVDNLEDKELVNFIYNKKIKINVNYNDTQWRIAVMSILATSIVVLISLSLIYGAGEITEDDKGMLREIVSFLIQLLRND